MEEENLLTFPIDVSSTLKHLRQDMKDDWFYDALRYEDLLSNEKDLKKILSKNLEEYHGQYESGDKAIYDVPKRALGLRYTLEIDFYDRFLYQAMCTYLIPYFDPLLSNRVLSHRYNKHGKKKYLFLPRIELWKTFENVSQLELLDGKTVLVTDLLNYFEQISIDAIEHAFIGMIADIEATGAEKNKVRSAVDTLTTLLGKWCYSDRHGLPQNRDASSFIANIVLDVVDKRMLEIGYDYYRYVDYIRIICAEESEAKKALNDLISALRKLGLNINSKKTAILTKDSDHLAEFFPSSDDTMTLIDTMWRSKSKKVIARSVPLLYAFLKKQIDNGATQDRPFRYCINRFKTLISSNLFDSKSILASNIADHLISQLDKQPVSTDQFCKLLLDLDLSSTQCALICEFIANEKVAIHSWQNYHLILLMAYKEYDSKSLSDHCEMVITQNPVQAETSACFLYLAAIGKTDQLESVISEYKETWSYQHQRYFLIALQNTDKKLLQPLFGHVNFRLKGTVNRIRNNQKFKGETIYVKDFNTTVINDIYDELSPYE